MIRLYINLLLLCVLLGACSSPGKDTHIPDASRTKTVLWSFTDSLKLDTFKLVLTGDKPKNMEFIFTITPENGKPVYSKIMKAKELLDNYKEDLDLGKEKKQISFIKEELNLFFEEENLLEPAVTETEEADKNTPDKKFFEELKRSGLNGFQYRTGKESKIYIGWSLAEKKVKPYYECCK
jgi:hypothetical protein